MTSRLKDCEICGQEKDKRNRRERLCSSCEALTPTERDTVYRERLEKALGIQLPKAPPVTVRYVDPATLKREVKMEDICEECGVAFVPGEARKALPGGRWRHRVQASCDRARLRTAAGATNLDEPLERNPPQDPDPTVSADRGDAVGSAEPSTEVGQKRPTVKLSAEKLAEALVDETVPPRTNVRRSDREAAVLAYLGEHGPMLRTALARECGIHNGSSTAFFNRMINEGRLVVLADNRLDVAGRDRLTSIQEAQASQPGPIGLAAAFREQVDRRMFHGAFDESDEQLVDVKRVAADTPYLRDGLEVMAERERRWEDLHYYGVRRLLSVLLDRLEDGSDHDGLAEQIGGILDSISERAGSSS